MRQSSRLMILVEGALMVALSVVLNFVKIGGPWVAGGAISLKALPIVIFALRYGLKWGLFVGFVFGTVDFILEPYFVNPIQFLFDYSLAYFAVGTAGVIRISNKAGRTATFWLGGIATVIGMVFEFICHYLSGIFFYASDAPKGQPVGLYSFLYNGSYVGPSMLGVLIVVIILASAFPNLITRRI
ncbi:energy-coupled thiamine transporter ThiT [Pullulanibacillus sp. KACC 23026]|uniref:energy-coupled thiamine transporter ThiT n=1 Tax=Pullulanibacillus sp. KACC 23026 TaxID=3028315 RepID=UPI0023B17307|nr:energy-coupled thiamine transporter ThiT [Pullulanibacillus sp. KACC 23026]WEG11625.1 energy-coupled thiamine transporter ThiT [Pullulanibacillus sp. KACC 23026]